MTETLPWVLFSFSALGAGVLWVRRHRRVGRGRHSEFDPMKSVAAFTKVAQTTYAAQDTEARMRLTGLRVLVRAKLSSMLAEYPGIAAPVTDEDDDAGRNGRHALVVDHRPPDVPVPPAV